jgi:predicted Fe-Mo cluster-binding NifX family protein
MRIAVPSNDGVTISQHFGRSKQFLIFDVHEGHAAMESVRENQGCHGHDGAGHTEGQPHSHEGILGALRGCDAVVCAGIGIGAVMALKTAGLQVVSIAAEGKAVEALQLWLQGRLNNHNPAACQCKH